MGVDHREEHIEFHADGSYSVTGFEVVSPDTPDGAPDGEWCYFCDEGQATTFFPLNSGKLIGFGNRGFSLGGPLATCDRCRDWFLRGSDQELLGKLLSREAGHYARNGGVMSADDEDWFRRETAADIQAFHDAAGEPSALLD